MDEGSQYSADPPPSADSEQSDPPEPAPDLARRRTFTPRSILFVLLCGLLGYFAFAALPLLNGQGTPNAESGIVQQAPATTAAATPMPEPREAPTLAAPAVPAGPAAAPPQRLSYPAAGIDVVIHPLKPSGTDQTTQTIVPPPTMDGYWLTPYGIPGAGSRNTTYVAGHSWVDRDAPFNRLSTKAAVGDKFTVTTATGKLAYRVDSVKTYVKAGLKDSPIWRVAPNRLVLISCYTGDFWGTNVVVVASPVPAVPSK